MEPLVIAGIIEAVIRAGGSMIDLIFKIRQRLAQDHELTLEEEKAFDDLVKMTMAQPHWKPDPTNPPHLDKLADDQP